MMTMIKGVWELLINLIIMSKVAWEMTRYKRWRAKGFYELEDNEQMGLGDEVHDGEQGGLRGI